MVNVNNIISQVNNLIDDYGSTIYIKRNNITVTSNGDKYLNLVDTCDELTTWGTTYGTVPTVDTSNKVEGYSCLQGGNEGTTYSYVGYSRTNFTDINLTDCVLYAYVYIADLTELATVGLIFIIGNNRVSGGTQDPQKRKEFNKSSLTTGWNLISFDVSNEGIGSSGTIDLTHVRSVRFNFYKATTGTLITHGDLKWDNIYYTYTTTTTGLPYNIFSGRFDKKEVGDINEGDLTLILKNDETIHTEESNIRYIVTYNSIDYDVTSVEHLKVDGSIVAQQVNLVRRQ